MRARHLVLAVAFGSVFTVLSGCASVEQSPLPSSSDPSTSPAPAIGPEIETPPNVETTPDIERETEIEWIDIEPEASAPTISTPSYPTPRPILPIANGFAGLAHWGEHDPRPAFWAFTRSCQRWIKAEPEDWLNQDLPQYGRYADWERACDLAKILEDGEMSAQTARNFFEAEFDPVSPSEMIEDAALNNMGISEGLLTGYYEPEVEVSRTPTAEFFEPILAKPRSEAVAKLPRAKLNANSARVIAYGRPIDVFFLQIQGSGRLKYISNETGPAMRAAYAGNNGHKYRSIGSVLIARGELKKSQVSKPAIAEWMRREGKAAARELMNENPRYIYFSEQVLSHGEGPKGAMLVPLTQMGSVAVDPRHHPYGSLIWLDTTLPMGGGDYQGRATGLLVNAQDTGSAIRGALRADLFYGAGAAAGARAGITKHKARWTFLLPKSLRANSSDMLALAAATSSGS